MAKPATKTPAPKSDQVPAVTTDDSTPAYLTNYEGARTNSTIDRKRLVIPRIKLLQAISPEVEAFDNARPGTFWHNILNVEIGEDFRFIPIMNREHYILFAPRGDSRGPVLARAPDGKNWDPADAEFEVKLKGIPKPVKWKTTKTVVSSGLDKFGSSIPGDPKSKPAATLILEFLCYLPDHEDCSPAIISLARSGVKRGALLETQIQLRSTKTPQFGQVYRSTITKEEGDEGPYNNWSFLSDGRATQQQFTDVSELAEAFKSQDFAASGDESLDEETREGYATGGQGGGSSGERPSGGHKEY